MKERKVILHMKLQRLTQALWCGTAWLNISEDRQDYMIDVAAKFLKVPRSDVIRMLKEGEEVPFDCDMFCCIRSYTAVVYNENKDKIIECDCGHHVKFYEVLKSDIIGTTCSKCYYRAHESKLPYPHSYIYS